MKNKALLSVAVLIAVIAVWKSGKKDDRSQLANEAPNFSQAKRVVEETPKPNTGKQDIPLQLAAKPQISDAQPKALNSEVDVRTAIDTVDLWNPVELSQLSNRLHATDAEFVSAVLEEGLDTPSRARMITVANENEGPHLSRFWQKVLESKEPTTIEVEGREEPNLFRNHEIHLAIRGLRLIATADVPTREYLERLVLVSDLHHGEDSVRKQALEALKEVDGTRASRVLRQLADTDTLNTTR